MVDAILFGLCLQRWNSRLRFYIQTDFYAAGMAFVGMQLANDTFSLDAMCREMAGGECMFLKDPHKGGSPELVPRLKPVCFSSHKAVASVAVAVMDVTVLPAALVTVAMALVLLAVAVVAVPISVAVTVALPTILLPPWLLCPPPCAVRCTVAVTCGRGRDRGECRRAAYGRCARK